MFTPWRIRTRPYWSVSQRPRWSRCWAAGEAPAGSRAAIAVRARAKPTRRFGMPGRFDAVPGDSCLGSRHEPARWPALGGPRLQHEPPCREAPGPAVELGRFDPDRGEDGEDLRAVLVVVVQV